MGSPCECGRPISAHTSALRLSAAHAPPLAP
jgi:hypothetical protein